MTLFSSSSRSYHVPVSECVSVHVVSDVCVCASLSYDYKWTKKKRKEKKRYIPGKSQGSDLQRSTSGMMEAGKGKEKTLRFKYWTTSSSSVGWKRKPGGNLTSPFFTKFIFSILSSFSLQIKGMEKSEMKCVFFYSNESNESEDEE